MSQFAAVVTPGYVWQDGELWTPEKANAAAQPTVNFNYTGGGTLTLGPGAVGIGNLQPGMFTADATGRAPFVNGWLSLALIGNSIFTADAYGRAPFASGWLTSNLVASATFTADTYGRGPFAAGWLTASLVMPDAYWYAVGTGTGSVITAAFTPALSAYTNPTLSQCWDGMIVAIKLPATLAAGATLNVGLGAKPIYRNDAITAAVAGDAAANSIVEFRYNSSLAGSAGGWQMLAPVSSPFYQTGTVAWPSGTTHTATIPAFATGTSIFVVPVWMSSTGTPSEVVTVNSVSLSGGTWTITFKASSAPGSATTLGFIAFPV